MKNEFRERLNKKRAIINETKQKQKELDLKDVTILCKRCNQTVSLLKTVDYISDDKHLAKCIFGHLRRVEEQEIIEDKANFYSDKDNRDFIQMYLEIFNEWREADPKDEVTPALPKYAFAECRNHHIVGVIKD